MKLSLEFITFAALLSCHVIKGNIDDVAWVTYKITYGKDYNSLIDGGSLDTQHKEIFLATLSRIHKHNSGNSSSYRQEINRFTDMFPTELKQHLGLSVSLASTARSHINESTFREVNLIESRQLPDSLDYRSDSCMSPIKDQGQCGSCWAFAAIAPLEFNHCKTHQQSPVVLSEQQLVDCDFIFDAGCNGGWYTNAWTYIMVVGGSARQSIYRYSARQNLICKFWLNSKFAIGARISSFNYVTANDPVAMQNAVQDYGPIAVAFAVVSSFYYYESGVYDDPQCDGQPINHAVVIVGWGNNNGVDFWIARNSWGTSWGLSGYIQIQRGVNKCSIETHPAYVVSASKLDLWQMLMG